MMRELQRSDQRRGGLVRTLSLGQMSALDVDVLEYIDIAAGSGCEMVSLMVRPPAQGSGWPLTARENLATVRAKLRDSGLSVLNSECFMLTPATNVQDFRSALDVAGQLGAKGVTALLYDPDPVRVSENLLQLNEIAARSGLRLNIEFMPLAPLCHTLLETVEFIEQLQQPNLGIAIDLLHLVRSGGTLEDVAATPVELISYVQVCDSVDASTHSDYAEEAGAQRLAPGEGLFPVVDFLRVLPEGVPVEIEVPQLPGPEPAKERITRIVKATQTIIEAANAA